MEGKKELLFLTFTYFFVLLIGSDMKMKQFVRLQGLIVLAIGPFLVVLTLVVSLLEKLIFSSSTQQRI